MKQKIVFQVVENKILNYILSTELIGRGVHLVLRTGFIKSCKTNENNNNKTVTYFTLERVSW